jgi:hypothetical protein
MEIKKHWLVRNVATRLRTQQGSDDDLNLIILCAGCHEGAAPVMLKVRTSGTSILDAYVQQSMGMYLVEVS